MSNEEENMMFYSDTMLCGPIPSMIKISEIMTSSIMTTTFIKDIYQFISEPTLVIIILTTLISALVYWRFNEGQYRNFTIRRQKEMLDSLNLTIDHLVKRDVITAILLKMSKKKLR